MSTLIDRYVWATIRSLPQRQRADVERELRASIADALDARLDAGTPAADAERQVLTELGDPIRLAAGYADRPLHLIGPAVFLDYQRVLTLLVSIVPPIAMGGVLLGGLLGGTPLPRLGAQAVSAGLTTLIHVAFWTTLLFVLIERSSKRDRSTTSWRPTDLPDLPADGREGIGSTAATVAALIAAMAAIYWQQYASPFRDAAGAVVPVLDPALWSFWLPFFIAVLVAEVVFAIVLYRRGGWTMTFALVNVVLNVAFTVPAVILLRTGRLLNGEVVQQFSPNTQIIGVLTTLITLVIIGVAVSDVIAGFVKARRAAAAIERDAAGAI